jgi:hypothetical protein
VVFHKWLYNKVGILSEVWRGLLRQTISLQSPETLNPMPPA